MFVYIFISKKKPRKIDNISKKSEQICTKFNLNRSTINYNTQLDLVLNSEDGGDLSDFITNGEWYLIG